MIIKIIPLLITSLLFFFPASSDEINCLQFKKLSAKYIECAANKLKEKTSKNIEVGKEKLKNTGIKDKLKKFKNSKTISDFIKN